MKNTRLFSWLMVLLILAIGCTPASLPKETDDQGAPQYFGTGGEHSVRPDDEKDG
ncbi:hypothetical protein [Aequorivita viscosa]|uniref:Uncharacterized protein n=1 Tax=Aequorivita viscosa TaxID=797419 RepID=A0A1M6LKX7_9FLAO|nr:hypothetical protein [Aequorivita viscosa]SDV99386.1 hypothetical protein SAMN05216556_1016 [Aequorivita viscosa]SHJ71849.1 hypothetical protein SAMN04487908_12366 [Aequorivita viscosa]